jgi:hypothetical protein
VPNRLLATTIILATILTLVVGIQAVEVVDANPLPPAWMNPNMTITIQSPQNGTHDQLPVLVNFTAQCSWQFSLNNTGDSWFRSFYYVLDGQNMGSSGVNFKEIQLTGTNPTGNNHFDYSGQAYLTNLNAGIHSITVYYGVLVNPGAFTESIVYNSAWSATSQFYVDTGVTIPTLLLQLIIAGTISVIIIVTIIFVYLRRKKGKS